MTTFEAFVLEAAGFRDHAEVTVWAHAPFNRELRLTIPADLGGTDPSVDFLRLQDAPRAGDARFTVDAEMKVLAWRVGEIDHSSL